MKKVPIVIILQAAEAWLDSADAYYAQQAANPTNLDVALTHCQYAFGILEFLNSLVRNGASLQPETETCLDELSKRQADLDAHILEASDSLEGIPHADP